MRGEEAGSFVHQIPSLSEGCFRVVLIPLHVCSATWVTKQAQATTITTTKLKKNASAGSWKSGLCVLNW